MYIFRKKMTLIADFFPGLWPAKNEVGYMCKQSRFRLPFQKEHGKRVSPLFKLERQNLRDIYCSTRRQFSYKKFLLVICHRLRLFVNTMTAVDKCSLPNRENLMQHIHMQFSQKLKFFRDFFLHFQNLG